MVVAGLSEITLFQKSRYSSFTGRVKMKTKTSNAACAYLLVGAFAYLLINYCSAQQTAPQSSPTTVLGNYDYSDRPANPAMAPVQDEPKLPRVLLIGDSISIGYTLPVRKRLAGVANVHRIPANGGPTTNGLAHV